MDKKKTTSTSKKGTTANTKKKNVAAKKTTTKKETAVKEVKKVAEEKPISKETKKKAPSKKVEASSKKKAVKETSKVVIPESAGTELKKLSTIFTIIVGIVCLFYIITVFVTKGESGLEYQSDDKISTISYVDILASDIFSKDGTYYVLVKDNEDQYISLYDTYISAYEADEDALNIYYVDLNDALNKKYKSDESNLSKDDLKFNGTTLLKISNGNIDSTYSDSESISGHLRSLISE